MFDIYTCIYITYICMYMYVHTDLYSMFVLVACGGQKRIFDPLELLKKVVTCHVCAGKQTSVLGKRTPSRLLNV